VDGGTCCSDGTDHYGSTNQQCSAAFVAQWDLGFNNTTTLGPAPFFHCSTDQEWFKVDVTGAGCPWNTVFRAQVAPAAGQQVGMELLYVCNTGPAFLGCSVDAGNRCPEPAANTGVIDLNFFQCDGNQSDLTGTMYVHVWPTTFPAGFCQPYTLTLSACIH
jgi:hypothetical protein